MSAVPRSGRLALACCKGARSCAGACSAVARSVGSGEVYCLFLHDERHKLAFVHNSSTGSAGWQRRRKQ